LKTAIQSEFLVRLELIQVFDGLQELSAKSSTTRGDQDGTFHVIDMREPSNLDFMAMRINEVHRESFFGHLFFLHRSVAAATGNP
jgi:hypothetical protein